jgi:hypothetical protein
MARTKSVVLSKDERRAIISDLRDLVKAGKVELKTLEKEFKAATKELERNEKKLDAIRAQ